RRPILAGLTRFAPRVASRLFDLVKERGIGMIGEGFHGGRAFEGRSATTLSRSERLWAQNDPPIESCPSRSKPLPKRPEARRTAGGVPGGPTLKSRSWDWRS